MYGLEALIRTVYCHSICGFGLSSSSPTVRTCTRQMQCHKQHRRKHKKWPPSKTAVVLVLLSSKSYLSGHLIKFSSWLDQGIDQKFQPFLWHLSSLQFILSASTRSWTSDCVAISRLNIYRALLTVQTIERRFQRRSLGGKETPWESERMWEKHQTWAKNEDGEEGHSKWKDQSQQKPGIETRQS